MKSQGFTLIELLAVITLLAIIFILVVPAVNKMIDKSKETVDQKQINSILNAAYDWSLKNSNSLPETNNKIYISLSDLKADGLIDSDIKNVKNKELYPDDLVISITNVGNSYKNEDKYAIKQGAYLYKIEESSLTNDNQKGQPIITLEGLTSNSNGNYVENVNINSDIANVTYKAVDSKSNDITNKLKIRITYNDKEVSKVDTTKAGIYKIIYTVIDDEGISNSVVRNIIVSDEEVPIISVPENVTIETSVKTFDLIDGVSCTDNSGNCNISTNGKITFGTPGKYVIEYTAKDPSGNTATEKRVITVK